MLYKSKTTWLSPSEEISILKKNIRDLQEQLQESYKRIKELEKNNEMGFNQNDRAKRED